MKNNYENDQNLKDEHKENQDNANSQMQDQQRNRQDPKQQSKMAGSKLMLATATDNLSQNQPQIFKSISGNFPKISQEQQIGSTYLQQPFQAIRQIPIQFDTFKPSLQVPLGQGGISGATSAHNAHQGRDALYRRQETVSAMSELPSGNGPHDGSKKHGRWTQKEKDLFIEALRLHGKDWKKVEQHIKTRSGAQIRSHAQKFFQNAEKTKGMDIDQYIVHLRQFGPPNENSGSQITPSNAGGNPISVTPGVNSGVPSHNNMLGISQDVFTLDQQSETQEQPSAKEGKKRGRQKKETPQRVIEVDKMDKSNEDGENVSDLSGISDGNRSGLSKISHSINSKIINQLSQNMKMNSGSSLFNQQNLLKPNQNTNQANQAGYQRGITSLLSSLVAQPGAMSKLRLSPTKMQSRSTDKPKQSFISALERTPILPNHKKISMTMDVQLNIELVTGIDTQLKINFEDIWKLKQYNKLDTQLVIKKAQDTPSILSGLQQEVNHFGFGKFSNLTLDFIEGHYRLGALLQGKDRVLNTGNKMVVLFLIDNIQRSFRVKVRSYLQPQEFKELAFKNGYLITLDGSSEALNDIYIEIPKAATEKDKIIALSFQNASGAQETNESIRESPVNVGKTPSFGGMAITQIKACNVFREEQPQDNQQRMLHDQLYKQQKNFPMKNDSFGMVPDLNNLQLAQYNYNQGLTSMGIGPQGRDRSYSSQIANAGFPTLVQQQKREQNTKFLLSKMNNIFQKASPQSKRPSLTEIIAKKYNQNSPKSINNFNQTDKDQKLSRSTSAPKGKVNANLLNILKPLLDKQNSKNKNQKLSNSPVVNKSMAQQNAQQLNQLIKQFQTKSKSFEETDQQQQKTDSKLHSNSNTSQQISPSYQQPKVQLLSFLKQLVENKQEQNRSGTATPKSQLPTQQKSSQKVQIEQIINAMTQNKGPQFPPRGFSGISGQSKISKQGFVPVIKQPLAKIPQKASDESHATLQSNNLYKINNSSQQLGQKEKRYSGPSGPSMGSNPSNQYGTQKINDSSLFFQNQQQKFQQNEIPQIPQTAFTKSIYQEDSFPANPPPPTTSGNQIQASTIDHTQQIKNLEIRKNSQYLNFISHISSNTLSLGDQETKDLFAKYMDMFSDIQSNFLKLYNREMKFYANLQKQQNQMVILNQNQNLAPKTAKNYINHDIVRNMIEILNIQIHLKLLTNLICKSPAKTQSGDSNEPKTLDKMKLKDMSPIDLRIFKQLIPLSYHQKVAEQLSTVNEEQQDNKESNSKTSENSPKPNQISTSINVENVERYLCDNNIDNLDQDSQQSQKSKQSSAKKRELKNMAKILEKTLVNRITEAAEANKTTLNNQIAKQLSSQLNQIEEKNQEKPEDHLQVPINRINTNTFQQIAQSLSPEPEKLLKQQAKIKKQQIQEQLSHKRSSPNSSKQEDFSDHNSSAQKRMRVEDKNEKERSSKELIIDTIKVDDNDQMSEGQEPPFIDVLNQKDQFKEIDENDQNQVIQAISNNLLGQQGDLALDVDQLIQGLLQQYQESQVGPSTTGGGAVEQVGPQIQMQATRGNIQTSPSANERIKIGGFRHTAYSDSHQELVKKMSGLSPEHIKMMGSADQRQKQRQVGHMGAQHKHDMLDLIAQQQLLVHLQHSSPVVMKQLLAANKQALNDEQDQSDQDEQNDIMMQQQDRQDQDHYEQINPESPIKIDKNDQKLEQICQSSHQNSIKLNRIQSSQKVQSAQNQSKTDSPIKQQSFSLNSPRKSSQKSQKKAKQSPNKQSNQ